MELIVSDPDEGFHVYFPEEENIAKYYQNYRELM